jgi:sulfur relay (sulfurtransferase) complex TusBCD TusD component (DsrE family)
MGPSLGILLAEHDRAGVAVELLRALAPSPSEAALFLMDDGVHAAADARVRALVDEGAEVSLCAMDAEARGVHFDLGGIRLGSQHDHAEMLRTAARVIAMTGVRIDDHKPARSDGRVVAVRITRSASHPKTAQALRSAVGYAAGRLRVAVLVEPPARALVASGERSVLVEKSLTTLRGLDMPILGVAPGTRPPMQIDLEVTW